MRPLLPCRGHGPGLSKKFHKKTDDEARCLPTITFFKKNKAAERSVSMLSMGHRPQSVNNYIRPHDKEIVTYTFKMS